MLTITLKAGLEFKGFMSAALTIVLASFKEGTGFRYTWEK